MILEKEKWMQEFIAFIKSRQPVNLVIVAANILVFIVLSFLGDTEDAAFMAEHGASFAPFVAMNGEYYRLFTCMFLHFGLEHLLYNMLVLIYMGDVLERAVGKLRYLTIYLVGGVAGNVLSVWMEIRKESYAVSAGASGAIFAVIGALVYIVVRNKGDLEEFSGRRLVLMAALSIVQGVTAQGVDVSAHVGGFVAGFFLAFLLGAAKKAAARGASRQEGEYL